MALRWLGRAPEMVRFPDEPHGLSRTGAPRQAASAAPIRRKLTLWSPRRKARPLPAQVSRDEPACLRDAARRAWSWMVKASAKWPLTSR